MIRQKWLIIVVDFKKKYPRCTRVKQTKMLFIDFKKHKFDVSYKKVRFINYKKKEKYFFLLI